MALRLNSLSDEQLMEVRLSELPLRIEGTPLKRRIRMLYRELADRGIEYRPHVWLSDEFFTPDGIPGFAIPFYLAHPRLMRLERKQMLQAEGGTEEQCMRILRHEAAHALDNAYRLHFKKSWREVFGSFAQAYPKSYKPKPNSRSYVLHLDAWYAQAHPAEDFAETFAVWLRPGSRWRTRYRGWPALEKLKYIDQLMKETSGMRPKNRKRLTDQPLSSLRITLGEYYRRKKEQYSLDYPPFYDRDLRRIFSEDSKYIAHETASKFLRRHRTELRAIIAQGTGVHPYTIDHVLRNIIERSRELKLRVAESRTRTRRESMIMLTVHTMNIVHSGRYRFHYGL